jgi:hypothetical protein
VSEQSLELKRFADAADLRAYRDRWRLVAQRERVALARTSVRERLSQVAALMASIDAMGWRDALSDDAPVWARWQRLRLRAGSTR